MTPFRYLNHHRTDLIALLQKLVRIPTVNPPGENYAVITALLTRELVRAGLQARRLAVPGTAVLLRQRPELRACPRYNVLGFLDAGAAKTVHFNAHYDVVPAGGRWRHGSPFVPAVEDGWIYGRGTADMKGSIASLLLALRALRATGTRPRCNVEVSFTADEETDSLLGAGWLVDQVPLKADCVVVMEGGEGRAIGCGHNGVVWLNVVVHGKPAHGSNPERGINALEKMSALVLALKDGADDDTYLRVLESVALDAILLPDWKGPLTLKKQLELRRIAALARKPLLLPVELSVESGDLECLRDAGVSVLLLDGDMDALPALIDPRTGRLHTSFNQAGAATGRLSSSNPNLQNIPIRTELGREIRAAFIPRDGWKLMVADYSQIELRLLAHFSKCPVLVEAFRNGEDIHTRTAAEVFGVPPLMVTPELRRRAKAVNFGIVYGLSAFGLAAQLGIPRTEAQTYIDGYFARYAGVRRFIDETIAEVRRTGATSTLFGRERPIPDMDSRNPNARGFAERTAVNTPLQGTAADLIKLAMIRIDAALEQRGLRTAMLLQVHDELLFESPPEELDEIRKLVKSDMENVAKLEVPLIADVGLGDNWRDAK